MLLPSLRDSISILSAQHGDVGQLFQSGSVPAAEAQLYDDVANRALPLPFTVVENLLSAFGQSDNDQTATLLASYVLVTACDMIPFVPCQPLAIALGAKLGFSLAFPIAAMGQTTAAVLAFSAARTTSDSPNVREALAKQSPETAERLEEFRRLTSAEGGQGDETRILSALVGLRLAPFFPFSAGNYLLGGTTRVPLRLFVAATLFGCLLSNFISVSVGAAGGALVPTSDFHF